MQTFAYKAMSISGERTEGVLSARTRRDALESLVGRGLSVLEISERRTERPVGRVRGLLRRRLNLTNLTRQLATLLRAGIPLARSLSVMAEQSEDERERSLLLDILEDVKAGRSLSEALGEHPDVFPEVMVSMVRMGEVAGTLDDVLARLAELFERQEGIRSEVRSALAYPVLVLLLGVASAVAMLAFVIPRLALMFEGLDQRLPLPTRMLIGTSKFFQAWWWALALGVAAAAVGVRMLRRNPAFCLRWDGLMLRVPVAGRVVRQAAVGRFARALGTLAGSDVPIVEALKVAQAAAGNRVIAASITDIATRIQRGDSLAALMKETGIFPPLPVQMVAVGEESGHLDEMLLQVAGAYDRETSASVRLMTSLLAPLLILCVAVFVAFLILSLVLPIFELSAGIQ